MIGVLIAAGADLEARDNSGMTPLHEAAMFNKTSAAAEALLAAGADVNARDTWGLTPLHMVASIDECPGMFGVLLAAGADPEARERSGLTPADITEYNETWRGARAWRRPWADEADEEKA